MPNGTNAAAGESRAMQIGASTAPSAVAEQRRALLHGEHAREDPVVGGALEQRAAGDHRERAAHAARPRAPTTTGTSVAIVATDTTAIASRMAPPAMIGARTRRRASDAAPNAPMSPPMPSGADDQTRAALGAASSTFAEKATPRTSSAPVIRKSTVEHEQQGERAPVAARARRAPRGRPASPPPRLLGRRRPARAEAQHRRDGGARVVMHEDEPRPGRPRPTSR